MLSLNLIRDLITVFVGWGSCNVIRNLFRFRRKVNLNAQISFKIEFHKFYIKFEYEFKISIN